MVQTILDGAGTGAAGRGLEAVDRVDLTFLVDAAALQPVGGVGIARVDLFQIAPAEVRLPQSAPQCRPARHQKVPGIGMAGAPVVRVAPGALGQAEFGGVVGAVVDALRGHQRLAHHHPDA
ncbi:hypothetical protein SDC9_113189 [bioreactor metagenome]|uniref:Uncharacterized protein n=1 Tax=bioreactor metagenome TaxID=1076179 RepID=A0A645BM76_9ZZZZ